MSKEILILGGGVSGVTAGIVFRLLGHRTRIVCRHWLGDADSAAQPYANEPRFASQYPAASIIPHSVQIADEAWHMRTNIQFFDALHRIPFAAVRKQRHYEVYEAPREPESYAPAMPGYRALPADGSGEPGAPRRSDDVPIYGWSFETLFAEMPRYRAFLVDLYQRLGGEAETGVFLDAAALEKRSAAAIVNCTGAWGAGLFGDTEASRFVKGILVRADVPTLPPGGAFSYNYRALRKCLLTLTHLSPAL